jgi:uncharacterized protein (TIGR02118 family)
MPPTIDHHEGDALMASFLALYGKPQDVEGFETYYRETHLPLTEGTAGVSELRVTRGLGTPRGGDAPYHLITEIVFESPEAMQEAMQSEAFRAVGKDAMEMCQKYGVEATMVVGEEF